LAADNFKTNTLIACLALVLAVEGGAWIGIRAISLPPILLLGLIRLFQIAGIVWIVCAWEGSLCPIGLEPDRWAEGLKKGICWSAAFAFLACIGMAAIWLLGRNPLLLLRAPLPGGNHQVLLLFLVGGLIGPVAEEIFFRGILYTYFRSRGTRLASRMGLKGARGLGVCAAILCSTLIFVVLHSIHGLPFTQIIGGLVFAAAYETSRNLLVPITIHVTGNLTIFAISLLPVSLFAG
jgi:membrane protease YdiL (CAAX protease family)